MRKSPLVVLWIVFSAAPGRAAGLSADLSLSSEWLAADEDGVSTLTI